MLDEQNALIAAAPRLFDTLSIVGIDCHVGVVASERRA